MSWEPGRRRALRKLEQPLPDVPDHLVEPLVDWIDSILHDALNPLDDRSITFLAVELRIRWDRSVMAPTLAVQVLRACHSDRDLLLDTVEWLLDNAIYIPQVQIDHLDRILLVANSAYLVRPDGKGLQHRVDPIAVSAVEDTITASAAPTRDLLVDAWNRAFGRNPDPSASISSAIKAVEAAYQVIISPTDQKATLGKMITNVRQKPDKWRFLTGTNATAPETVGRMLDLVWKIQSDRHGSSKPPPEPTIEEARAAVHVAVTLVQLAQSGAFHRVED